MTVDNRSAKQVCANHVPAVKLRAGASIVKVKPLFTCDSKYILVASGCNIKVFSIASGECVLVFKGHKHPVVSLHINMRNNLQILSCSEDGTVIRWDHSDGKSLKKYSLGLKNKVVAFYAPSAKGPWFATTMHEDKTYCAVFSLPMKKLGPSRKVDKIINSVNCTENSVSFGPEASYVAGIFYNSLLLFDMQSKKIRRHKTGELKLTCVACHPKECIVATGDVNGRIIVWAGMLETNYPTRSIYHWHSLSLPDLAFSSEGSHIYSAGGEAVLVKWNLDSGTKQTLPRLGLPICHLAVSSDNTYIAVAHTDNALQIINSHNRVVQVVQGLSRGHCGSFRDDEVLPTGMIYDPRSMTVVMNGRPGHLQFYNILEDKQLFHLDIVGQNFMSQEREGGVINTDVIRAAIDINGLWLATIECRDDGETSPEIRLKFFEFDVMSQTFLLNTNIFLPHNKKVNCVKFQPQITMDDDDSMPVPQAVTTSDDNRFKMWTLREDRNDTASWSCLLVGCYKDMRAGDACFSEDGSLLCVAFGHAATLWSPDVNVLKTTLCHSQAASSIQRVLFGRNECNHLLICHTNSTLIVWNVLSLSILWTVNCRIQCLVDDHFSDIMASFTDDRNLFIFKPSNPEPLSVLKNVSTVPIVAAVFLPQVKTHTNQETPPCCWQQQTKLFFLNKNQEMLTVADNPEENNEDESEKFILHQSLPVTPFGVMQAEHHVSDVKPLEEERRMLHGFGVVNILEPMDLPCPTTVNPISLCEDVLPSLLKAALTGHMEKTENSEDDERESDEANVLCEEKVKGESKTISSTSIDLLTLKDYSFLLDYET